MDAVAALEPGAAGRITVRLASGREIVSSLDVVSDLRLYPGLALEEEALHRLEDLSSLSRARTKALELLSRRAMSASELRDKLLERGVSEQNAAACLDWLRERRYLDDESYAASVVRHYGGKGYGRERIRQELRRRGIDRELAEAALETRPEADEQLDRLIAARLRDPSDKDACRKLAAALYRRGFSWDEIRAAMRRFAAEAEEP